MQREKPAGLGQPSARYRATIRVLWDTSRPLSLAVAAYTGAASLVPILVLVAAGHLVGDVPAAARHGLSSAAGHRMLVALGLTGASYAGALLLGPIQSALSSTVKWRVVYRTQARLIGAACGPAGIGHLEDAGVLNDLALAQGQLVNQRTADAPMTLAIVIGNRASGFMACLVLAYVRWWLGVGMVLMWVLVRAPQLKLIRKQGALYAGASEVLRRAWYLHRLASRSEVAKESRVFGLGGWMVGRYRHQWLLGMSEPWSALESTNRVVLALSAVVLGAFTASCGYLGYAAYHHEVTLTTLAVTLPMLAATTTFGDISWDDVALAWQMEGLPRIASLERQLAERASELTGRRGARGLPARHVRFEAVRFSYPGADRSVFEALDLLIPAGQSTAVVGINGAGKTTLVKLLSRLEDPLAGRILVDDLELSSFDARGWQRLVAVVFQDFARYPLSLRENVGWGSPEHIGDDEGLQACTELAGARLGVPWDTVLSRSYEGGVDLSGGQWQRVALARALFAVRHGARILVLDEPTAWLDARGEADFFDRFLTITRGTTSLIISHRFSTVRRADHICVLDGGRVTEQGDHAALLARGGRYAELFRLQAARYEDAP